MLIVDGVLRFFLIVMSRLWILWIVLSVLRLLQIRVSVLLLGLIIIFVTVRSILGSILMILWSRSHKSWWHRMLHGIARHRSLLIFTLILVRCRRSTSIDSTKRWTLDKINARWSIRFYVPENIVKCWCSARNEIEFNLWMEAIQFNEYFTSSTNLCSLGSPDRRALYQWCHCEANASICRQSVHQCDAGIVPQAPHRSVFVWPRNCCTYNCSSCP